MHRFWEINEMVRLLATILNKQYEASASAVALACCSKRLEDIVLDSVWEKLIGLEHLMRCLPTDTWEIHDDEFGSTTCSSPLALGLTGQQTFLRCPANKEWIRFSSYARRIHVLWVVNNVLGDSGVSLAAFNVLSMHTPTLGHHPLPNLRSIYWEADSWGSTPFLRLFLNPELVDVHIMFPGEGQHVYRSAIVSLIPTGNLTHLRLEFMGDDDPSLGAVLHNLLDEASETLRSVTLDGELSISVTDKLLQLPNLRYFDVQLPRARISPPAVVLPSLEKLDVSYGEAWSWHILENIPNLVLQKLLVIFTGSSPTYLQTLGSSLVNANVERTLTSITCTSENIIPLTEAGIRPLLSFGRLTKLELVASCTASQCGVKLDDSIISDLAVALPQLEHLGLGSTPCDASTSDVTIASLVALSTNCVNLDYLRLHFNTNDIITRGTHKNSQAHKFTCKLRTLSVGFQPLSPSPNDIFLITLTILHIFPHVENILPAGGNWNQVVEGIRLFRKVPEIIPLPAEN